MQKKNNRLSWRIAGLLFALCAGQASAQLANNIAVDVRAMSMGHAVTADPPGIMAIHFNPAGLAKLDGRRMDLQFVGADFSLESEFSAPPGYNVFGFSDDPIVCNDAPNDGVDYCRDFKTATSSVEGISLYLPFINDTVDLPPGPLIAGPLPAFSIRPAGSKFTFGTATYLPLAAGFYRDEDDVGNYMGERVALERITYLSPSVGYRVNDELSIGASIGLSFLPTAVQNEATVKLNKSTKGAGPDARPPKVFNGAPAGLILLTSHFGMWPPYSKDISSLKALAHPNFESATTMVVSVGYNSSGTVGSCFT